jgi:hypothetical protein
MPVASRALSSSYLVLVAAGVCEMTIPGVLWAPSPSWFRASVCVLLAASFVGSVIRSKTIRAIGWVGIALFACILLWNTLFADFYIALASMEDFPTGSHAAQYKWRGLLFVAHAALLAICFKKMWAPTDASKRFHVVLGSLLVIIGVGFVLVKLEMAPMGLISVHYDGKSTSGVFLLLENKSSQAIYVRGVDQMAATCTNIDTMESHSPPYGIDGFSTIIRISPGERLRMFVAKELLSTFERGHCHVRVPLLGGAWVESDEFSPE